MLEVTSLRILAIRLLIIAATIGLYLMSST